MEQKSSRHSKLPSVKVMPIIPVMRELQDPRIKYDITKGESELFLEIVNDLNSSAKGGQSSISQTTTTIEESYHAYTCVGKHLANVRYEQVEIANKLYPPASLRPPSDRMVEAAKEEGAAAPSFLRRPPTSKQLTQKEREKLEESLLQKISLCSLFMGKFQCVEIEVKIVYIHHRLNKFEEWMIEECDNGSLLKNYNNQVYKEAKDFLVAYKSELCYGGNTSGIDAAIGRLNQLGSAMRDKIEFYMRKLKGLNDVKCPEVIDNSRCIVHEWNAIANGRLNTLARRIDAEERKMKPAEKKKTKRTMKKLRENVRAFQRKIEESRSRMSEECMASQIRLKDGKIRESCRCKSCLDEFKGELTRFNIEWLLFVGSCEEAFPAVKRDWFRETSSSTNGISVKPFFEEIEKLNAEFKTNDWMDEMSEEAREMSIGIQQEIEHGEHDFLKSGDFESGKLEYKFQNGKTLKRKETKTERDARVANFKSKLDALDDEDGNAAFGIMKDVDKEKNGLSEADTYETDVKVGTINGEGSSINDDDLDGSDGSTTKSQLRHCASEACGIVEPTPRTFLVCQKCRDDSKRFCHKFERSYYCGEACLEIDWKQRHRRFHKEQRRRWQGEMTVEEQEGEERRKQKEIEEDAVNSD